MASRGPAGRGGRAQQTGSAKQPQEAYLEEPPAEELLDETHAPEDVSVEVGVDHAGVDHVGGHGAPLGGQQPLQVVSEQDKGQLALGVGAVRGVAAAVEAIRDTCETRVHPSPAQVPNGLGPYLPGSLHAEVPTHRGPSPPEILHLLGPYLPRSLRVQVPICLGSSPTQVSTC